MKRNYFVLLFLFCFKIYCQKTNYIEYHLLINKAEELFFVEQKVDSSLFYYENAFKKFDFVFVKDLINAAQISIYSNKPYKKFIERGFKHGLKLSHLELYPIFKDKIKELKSDRKLLKKYSLYRKEYLSKINFEYLDWIYKLAIKDQKEKLIPYEEYSKIIYNTTEDLIAITKTQGFPGDKIIGLRDSLIFAQIGKPNLDLYNQIKNDNKLDYMTNNDRNISSTEYVLTTLVHNGCSFYLYEDVLLEELKKGNIHPREIGLLYDNQYRYINYFPDYCDKIKLKGYFLLNLFTEYEDEVNIEEANLMRSKLFIVSTFVDDKKKEFEAKYGFKLFSGFWNCR